MPDPFDHILGQPKVRAFLRGAVNADRVGHAYLFTGMAGSNKTQAAYALAQSVVCKEHGCGDCDDCKRAMRRKHPDIHYLAPEGAGGYLIEQMREVMNDVDLAPIQSHAKVYIIDRVDLLGIQAANAFLKTLEEPPENVVMILLGRTRASVLPTIVSRCQVVPFRTIPTTEARGIVVQNTGCTPLQAAVGIQACGGSTGKAIEFVKNLERFEFRARVIEVLQLLEHADDMDILEYAQELLEKAQAPLDLVRKLQDDELAESAEFASASALRQIEQRNKRALSAKSTEMLTQLTNIVRSWLRDVLMVCSGAPHLVINEDVAAGVREAAAHVQIPHVVAALSQTDEAETAIRYNVSPETCVDVLLFEIREELYGSHSAG